MQSCNKKQYASPKREGLDVFMKRLCLHLFANQLIVRYCGGAKKNVRTLKCECLDVFLSVDKLTNEPVDKVVCRLES